MNPQALLIMTAEVTSYDELIDQLDNAIKEYQIAPSEEKQQAIFLHSLLVVTKQKIEADGGFINTVKNMKEAQEAFEVGSRITGADKMS